VELAATLLGSKALSATHVADASSGDDAVAPDALVAASRYIGANSDNLRRVVRRRSARVLGETHRTPPTGAGRSEKT